MKWAEEFPATYLSARELKGLIGKGVKKTVRVLDIRKDHDVGEAKETKVVFALGTPEGEPWRDWIPNAGAREVLETAFGSEIDSCINMLIEIWVGDQTYKGKATDGIFIAVPRLPAPGPRPQPPIVNPPTQPVVPLTTEQLTVPVAPQKRGRKDRGQSQPSAPPADGADDLSDSIPF